MASNSLKDAPESFGDKVRRAVIWRSGTQILAQILSWGSTLIVVRLLDPSDYGLFAMTQVVLVFFGFLAGYGFASALIQSEEVDPKAVRQAFTLLLGINAVLALAQIAVAPLAADYYNQPIVADMLRWQALIYLATPFAVVPEVLMSRDLEFKRPAITNLTASATGAAVALGMAFSGWGVWTLVAAPIALFWVRGIMLTAFTGFIKPTLDFKGAGAMIGFGAAVFVGHAAWIFQSQSDIFIAGRVLDPHVLGIYAEALFLTQLFAAKFVPPLNEVAFPAYARLQNDKKALGEAFLKAARLILIVAMPVYAGLFATADAAVMTLFGPKWTQMVPLVEIICIAMPVMTLQILFAPALNAVGKPWVAARIAMVGAVLMPATYYLALKAWGVFGLAWGWVIAFPILLIVTFLLSHHHIQLSGRGLVRAIWPGLSAAGAMALLVMGLDRLLPASLPAIIELAICAGTGAAFYVGLLYLLSRDTFDEVKALVLKKQPPVAIAT